MNLVAVAVAVAAVAIPVAAVAAVAVQMLVEYLHVGGALDLLVDLLVDLSVVWVVALLEVEVHLVIIQKYKNRDIPKYF
jgi:hypothetical protein